MSFFFTFLLFMTVGFISLTSSSQLVIKSKASDKYKSHTNFPLRNQPEHFSPAQFSLFFFANWPNKAPTNMAIRWVFLCGPSLDNGLQPQTNIANRETCPSCLHKSYTTNICSWLIDGLGSRWMYERRDNIFFLVWEFVITIQRCTRPVRIASIFAINLFYLEFRVKCSFDFVILEILVD